MNVSPIQFRQAGFVEKVGDIITRSGIEPNRLTLEITESILIEDLVDTANKLNALKELGVRISIDDFGTGYCSLYYLKHLPLDELKIDRAYVQDIISDPNNAAMVEIILSIAKHLDLVVVAEGVETEAQMTFLRDNGCKNYQGYHFSHPVSATQLTAEFSKRNAIESGTAIH